MQAFESLQPPVEARGSVVSISQQTIAENAKAHAQLKLGFPTLSDLGGRIAQLFGVRWCISEPRNVRIEPYYYSAVGNLQGAQIMTWMWF
ncbi:hypothetical protein [Bradyrhizobium sp. Ash2021]|uniref:peroxiredoxin family protein n=1 Tax=Bradyrhizobium sp. Ash2021 TaxID=2954771 RepID=UPI00281585C1|nr:hypothetical protein [Bradyrhizobium sp. Ash2021]WMT76857.1 peroxiredoxin family protein [Bradyrhizobium sp. Ash2021]